MCIYVYTYSFATNNIFKRRDATKTPPTWQDLGAHIHQGDQAQEKLRKEKETLEATEKTKNDSSTRSGGDFFFSLPTVLGSEVLDVFFFFLILFVCF